MLLLGHQEDDVVNAGHLINRISINLLCKIQSARHLCSGFFQRLHVRLVAIDEFDLTASLADKCTQNGSQ